MGFFNSSSSHFDAIHKECLSVGKLATEARAACEMSLRGKHEMMEPEERAGFLKTALAEVKSAHGVLEDARHRETQMEQDKCPSEDILKAHARILDATLDIQKAERAIEEGRRSLEEGLREIEQFFGATSREAREVRKVLAGLQAG